MVRAKARARRRPPSPAPPTSPRSTSPPPGSALPDQSRPREVPVRTRPVSVRTVDFQYYPKFIHASPRSPHLSTQPQTRVAVLYEIDVPENAKETAMVGDSTFREARKKAFEGAHATDGLECADDFAVFVKHCSQGVACLGGRITHRDEGNGGFCTSSMLEVVLAPRDDSGMKRQFWFGMQDYKFPICLCKLVEKKALGMYYDVARNVIQMVAFLVEDAFTDARKREWSNVLSWLWHFKRGAPLLEQRRPYDKDWVFEQVRRRKDDADAMQYEQYLDHIRQNTKLHATLRPYQERAVAWMLSRELGEPLHLFRDFVWEEAAQLAEQCVLRRHGEVQVVDKVAVNLLEGEVRPLEDSDSARVEEMRDVAKSGRGGLLCDEMGLGKTVELLQLVLCNQMDEEISAHRKESVPSKDMCSVCAGTVSRKFKRGPMRAYACLECGCVTHRLCLGDREMDTMTFGYVCEGCCDQMQQLVKEDAPVSQLPRSKATVVIIPTTLLLQWQDEIQKHSVDALNVVLFQGLRRSGYVSRKRLMEADIVLTTYDALRADVDAFKAVRKPRSGLRARQRYKPVPMPLVTMYWHRLAMDESQQLGSSKLTQAAEMVSHLHATHKWCITGTPMARSAENIIPMLDMLEIMGGYHLMDWSAFFSPKLYVDGEERVKSTLRTLMWRTSKEDVDAEELQLPPQVKETVTVAFGPVEKYHYKSLQQSVRTAMMNRKSPDGTDEDKVSSDLLTMLRQACCHPQIGISGRRLMSRAARQMLTHTGYTTKGDDAASIAAKRAESPLDMNEVLGALVTKAKIECEETLRDLVRASNGLAAVLWLQHSILPTNSVDVEGLVAAVNLYRHTLRLVEENRNVVRLDNIQRMHILFNLKEALDSISPTAARIKSASVSDERKKQALRALGSVGSTLRDGNLSQEVDALRRDYVAEAEAALVAATASYTESFDKLGDQPLFIVEGRDDEDVEACDGEERVQARPHAKRKRVERPWWVLAVATLLEMEEKKQESFLNRTVRKLIEALPGGGVNTPTLANRLTSILVIPMVVETELRELQKSRCRLRESMFKLPGSVRPTEADVTESGQCAECREFGVGRACIHCRSERLFTDVERRLYFIHETDEALDSLIDAEGSSSRSTSVAHELDPSSVLHGAFHSKAKANGTVGQNSGLRYQAEVETVLKALAAPLKAKGDSALNRKMEDWFNRFEGLKKEHVEARRMFEAQRSLLASLDEVNSALMRLTLLDDDEDFSSLPEIEKRHRLPKASLPSLNVQFSNEKAVAEADFRTKRGGLVYLSSLEKASKRDEVAESAATGTFRRARQCPVCLSEFDETVSRVAVFVCGHVLCCDCTLLMVKKADAKSRVSSITCPTCRVKCPVEEINFTINRPVVKSEVESREAGPESQSADAGGDEDIQAQSSPSKKRKRVGTADILRKVRKIQEPPSTFHDRGAPVIGLVGAKASAVIRTLHGIWNRDPSAKVLIFSEWLEVLNLLAKALTMNGIRHLHGAVSSSVGFANVIDAFKTTETHNVILLPLRRAGAGLNITEAEHVILMEPSMDVSLELQAIGRVHRIGQEKVTFVHRILVKETVEDIILALGDMYRGGAFTGHRSIQLNDVIGSMQTTAADPEIVSVDED